MTAHPTNVSATANDNISIYCGRRRSLSTITASITNKFPIIVARTIIDNVIPITTASGIVLESGALPRNVSDV